MLVPTYVCAQTRVCLDTCLPRHVFAHTRVGHKCVSAQTCLGTNMCGNKHVWAQSCGLKYVWTQSCGLRTDDEGRKVCKQRRMARLRLRMPKNGTAHRSAVDITAITTLKSVFVF